MDTSALRARKSIEKRIITIQKPMMSGISSRPAFLHPQQNG